DHHASADGYLPSPIVLGSALAAVTQQMLIHLAVVLLPLYHPLRAAEDLAVLDLVSGGRLRLTVAGGYREEEYAQFGLDIRKRPSRMERAVAGLKGAWTGEPVEFDRRPVPVPPPPPPAPVAALSRRRPPPPPREGAPPTRGGFGPDGPPPLRDLRRRGKGPRRPGTQVESPTPRTGAALHPRVRRSRARLAAHRAP